MIEFRVIGDPDELAAVIEEMRRSLNVARVSRKLPAHGKPSQVRRYVYASLPAAPVATEPVELDGDTIIALLTAKGDEVDGWTYVATVKQQDLRGQHVVIRDQAGRYYATPSTAWEQAAAQDRVVFTPVIRHEESDTTRYELVGGER